MLRYLLAASLFIAAPALAQGHAPERAAHCVYAAMTSLLTVGASAEQLAPVALARCYDEIDAMLTNVKAEAVRIALRRELYDYAVQVAGTATFTETSSVTLDFAQPAF